MVCWVPSRTQQDRPRLAVEFSDFVGNLLQKRKDLKKSGLNRALEQSIKLFINTMYGVLASKYFPVNNVVSADIITSAIRVKVWLKPWPVLLCPLNAYF